jgi:hypothetical protein
MKLIVGWLVIREGEGKGGGGKAFWVDDVWLAGYCTCFVQPLLIGGIFALNVCFGHSWGDHLWTTRSLTISGYRATVASPVDWLA